MPVVSPSPLHTIYAAVTRRSANGNAYLPDTPAQAMTLPEALKGYTIGSAWANGMEHKTGSLETGKFADIAVIDRNLFSISPEEIKDCNNICTIFDGEIIYDQT